MVVGEGILAWLIRTILYWLLGVGKRMAEDYFNKVKDEKANEEIREGTENAQTDEEAQEALNDAARRAGRRP